MALKRYFNLGGINLFTSPFLKKDGELLRCTNLVSDPYGAKSKRAGYETYLGAGNGSAVQNLFSWTKDDGTTLFTYKKAGDLLYYSAQGTAEWVICGNGTLDPNSNVGHTVLSDTLIIGDNVGSTRHTTDGMSFTNTTLAPPMGRFESYQGRVYGIGTASTLFYSSSGDATDWNTSGTSDSSSFQVPEAGRLNSVFKVADRLSIGKTSGKIFRWDGNTLLDTGSGLAPSSPESIAQTEGYYFGMNNLGLFGYGAGNPEILSNVVQPYIYNKQGNGVVGSNFGTMPASTHRYDYYTTMGTVTDDLTNEPISNAILNYNFQKNEFTTHTFANVPTAYHSFKDENGVQQLIFGDSTGQCYKLSGTATTDNGTSIPTVLRVMIDFDSPETEKKWNWLHAMFNPSADAKIRVAFSDTYDKSNLKWIDLGNPTMGYFKSRFPQGSQSRLLFIEVYENSLTAGYTCYGFAIDAELQPLE